MQITTLLLQGREQLFYTFRNLINHHGLSFYTDMQAFRTAAERRKSKLREVQTRTQKAAKGGLI
ncbi:hypothetical protein SRABI106_03410 [Rahnella aquatilis]|nr:hypothetical protein SRABI106_03410 [Rahnella aquatilis]